ncbi:MAG: hypothetical protein M3071_17970 [Actinomycetota bacterium]|nr:hypothetical protein [Actinomycetota bacterium]
MKPRIVAVLTGLAVATAATLPALATAKAKPKPSLKIAALSVNQQYFTPGTKVTQKAPINACYGIGGASFDPMSLTVVGFVHAVGVPSSAKTTVKMTTPWATAANGTMDVSDRFSKVLFKNKGHGVASTFGGAQGPYDFYTYLMLPTGYPTSSYIDGLYTMMVTTQAGSKTLHASGSVVVAC